MEAHSSESLPSHSYVTSVIHFLYFQFPNTGKAGKMLIHLCVMTLYKETNQLQRAQHCTPHHIWGLYYSLDLKKKTLLFAFLFFCLLYEINVILSSYRIHDMTADCNCSSGYPEWQWERSAKQRSAKSEEFIESSFILKTIILYQGRVILSWPPFVGSRYIVWTKSRLKSYYSFFSLIRPPFNTSQSRQVL